MESISFKNFRRFAEFPEFKFGDVTILVGGNNAGKSTLIKALLLIFYNLRKLERKNSPDDILGMGFFSPRFRFDADDFHDLHLGTFSRSLFKGAQERSMEFTICISKFKIRVVLVPDDDANLPIAKIVLIEIKDVLHHILYTFNFNTCRMRMEFEKIAGNGDPKFDEINDRIKELRNKTAKGPLEAAETNQEIEKLLEDRNTFIHRSEKMETEEIVEDELADLTNLGDMLPIRPISLLASYVFSFLLYYNEKRKDREESKTADLIESTLKLDWALSKQHVYYIQAHGVSPKMLYRIDDKNDFIAQTIHAYARYGEVVRDSKADTFIRKWMKEFGIGADYEITSIGGEGYILEVVTDNGKRHLADMGMGAIQLIVLLLNLATIMLEEGHYDKKNGGRSFIPKFIIIEEPEQNLHPRLQSHLADLIAEVAEDDSYKFLIETHSEYLIRRTQVLVAEMNIDNKEELEKQNPFKVYYFPENGIPYDMIYRPDGRFVEEFGTGFFDEASNLTFSLF